MKRIRTIHPKLIVGKTLYTFTHVGGIYFEGDVPDEVVPVFMGAKRHPNEFVLVQPPKVEVEDAENITKAPLEDEKVSKKGKK